MPGAREHFADSVIERTRRLGHPLCVGLDPHLDRIPALFRRGEGALGDPRTAAGVGEMLAALVPRLAGKVAVVKPQIAFFEQLGPAGLTVLAELVARCREAGLLVLMDAKRGDIGSTAVGYRNAFFGDGAALESDALTLNPYLGLDSLQPMVEAAEQDGRGLFVLVRTSNPGSRDFQELRVGSTPVYERVASALAPTAERLAGDATGFSSLGVVVGATQPDQAVRVRELLPKSLFLVPGYGAQGGSAADALRGFVPGPAGLEGGLVNSSRGVVFPAGSDTDSASGWERAIDDALGAAIDELGAAVSA